MHIYAAPMLLERVTTILPTYEKIYEGDRGWGGGGGMSSWVYIQIVLDYTYSFIVGIYNAMFNLKEGKTI